MLRSISRPLSRQRAPILRRWNSSKKDDLKVPELQSLIQKISTERPTTAKAYRDLQDWLDSTPYAINTVVARNDLMDRCMELIQRNWRRNINARLWTINGLSLLAHRDHPGFMKLLTYLFRDIFNDHDLMTANITFSSYGRQYQGRGSMLAFLQEFRLSNDFWPAIADFLARYMLTQGKPLASVIIALRHAELIPLATVELIARSMPYTDAKLGLYHLKALQQLLQKFPKMTLESSTKDSVIRAGMDFSSDQAFSLADECVKMVRLAGPAQPQIASVQLIRHHIRQFRTGKAYNFWKEFDIYDDIMKHPKPLLTTLIYGFSKTRNYFATARRIVDRIPQQYYGHEGILDALIIYCARRKDLELAKTVYEHIEAPIPRSTLSSLLYMHAKFNDSEGVQKIYQEILDGEYDLEDHEVGLLVTTLAKNNVAEAENVARWFGDKKLQMRGLLQLSAFAIDNGFHDVAFRLLKETRSTIEPDSPLAATLSNTMIKLFVCQGDLYSAKREWQHRLITVSRQSKQDAIGLRTILDAALTQDAADLSQWLWTEFMALGYSKQAIQKTIQTRRAFEKVTDSKPWLTYHHH